MAAAARSLSEAVMVLVRIDVSEATPTERAALPAQIETLRAGGLNVVIEDKADLVRQTRQTLLAQFRLMGLCAGDAFGERQRVQLLTFAGPFNPREREAFPQAMRDLVDSGFFDIDAKGRLTVSRAGQVELYPIDKPAPTVAAAEPAKARRR